MSLGDLALRRDAEYYGVPQKYVVGDSYISQSYINKTIAANSFTVTGYQNVKRRIYLIQDGDKIRVLAFGFRSDDASEIADWATNGIAALSLEIDPNEVDVRWLTPALKPTGL